MLDMIGLQNFKAFHSLPPLPLSPITVLCGTNSSGKSTLLQSVLLAKQSVESKLSSQTLLLNGRFVRLGMFEDVIFDKNPNNEVTLDFSFSLRKDSFPGPLGEVIVPFRFSIGQLVSAKSLRIPDAEYDVRYMITLALGGKRKQRTQLRLRPIVVKALEFRAQTRTEGGDIIPGAEIEMHHTEGRQYKVKWKTTRSRSTTSRPKTALATIKFANLWVYSIRPESGPRGEDVLDQLGPLIHPVVVGRVLAGLFSTYTYIGPLREAPSRRYIYEDEVLEIGIKGENAAYISLTDYYRPIRESYFYDEKTDSFRCEQESLRLGDALQTWLDTMGIAGFEPTADNRIISLNLDSGSSKMTRVNIADVGFGVSQVLPIVLEGLRMPRGNTLLLEQPEIHLHPNLQMQMADYFISLALSKKNVIIETHSDHIVNRLVRRIVEDESLNLKDLIRIYFITPSPGGSRCEEVQIDRDLGIVNWPDDFFDQTASEQERTMQAGLRNRKARRDPKEPRS